MSHRKHCLHTRRNQPDRGGRILPVDSRVFALFLFFLMCVAPARGAVPIGSPTPPPPPQVPPVISETYPTDLNGNRIGDALEPGTEGTGELSIAAVQQDQTVKVELVFSEPVTQQQIDDFLRLGGEITYIYQVLSYGWNGRIPRENIDSLPSAMGPTLVQVEPVQQFKPCMDMATRTGRVRPVWQPGFAGSAAGFEGGANTTIAFIGDGVDATHLDLKGRCVYWKDFSEDGEAEPVDFDGHDSVVVGVAVGSGAAGGADAGVLHYTLAEPYPSFGHLVEPIWIPSGSVTITSEATWTGGGSAWLDHIRYTRGTFLKNPKPVGTGIRGKSPLTATNTYQASASDLFTIMLSDFITYIPLDSVVITTSVSSYPGVGDGFNKFRGVAPGCKWAAVKVFDRDGDTDSDTFAAGLDDLVQRRTEMKIKVINISHGLHGFLGLPAESTPLRDKVNSIVNNGIVVVAAAGNDADGEIELERKMADPARAALAITVGATNDENILTEYSTYGFFSPRKNVGEDYKPDLVAPGGSLYQTGIISVDSGTSDGINMDKEPNDYAVLSGTSFSAPFVSGVAALIIQAMERQGVTWDFNSASLPKFVKMLLCATAGETNAEREGGQDSPTVNRADAGPNLFPVGKDAYEGYGLINPDAAIEAICLTYAPRSDVTAELGGAATNGRVWARTVNLTAGCDIDITLDNPTGADFDLYLYSMTPGDTGTPVILTSSTQSEPGADETVHYAPTSNLAVLLVIKRVSGSGTFSLHSQQAGPPVAQDMQVTGGLNVPLTITLKAKDDGSPNPPGALSYTIASLPQHGTLATSGGSSIATAPKVLAGFADKVIYQPATDWVGEDSFTFHANDGGLPPFGGQSNTATVRIVVVREITVEYQVASGVDDTYGSKWGSSQMLDEPALLVGQYLAGLRFCGIKVPKGAEIKSATLKVCSYSSSSGLTGEINGTIQAEAADNPADFSGFGRAPSQASKTDAMQTWKLRSDEPWTSNTWYESPDIHAVIQEIIDRPGWAPDNAMVIIFSTSVYNGSDRKFWSYEGKPANAARLTITYQPR